MAVRPHTLPPLVLWDIDGTMLRQASRAHGEAIYEALRRVHGIEDPAAYRVVDAAGRTDPAIIRDLLLAAGIAAQQIDARAGDVRQVACERFAQRCPASLADQVAPGVLDALEQLRGWARCGLVTGNYEPIARLKLRRAGIATDGWPGGFGSDSESRADLPPLARERAAAGPEDPPWPRERTVIVGDTPRDIACAHADGLRVVAIASGPYDADVLTDADAVLEDAHSLAVVLRAMLR